MNYNLTFVNQAIKLLPPILRFERIVALMQCFLHPLQQLRDGYFNVFYPDIIKRTKYTSQVIVFTAILDAAFPGVYISNILLVRDPFFVYRQGEGFPPTFLNASGTTPEQFVPSIEDVFGAGDFIVFVPAALTAQTTRIQGVVDSLKLAGTRYNIVYN